MPNTLKLVIFDVDGTLVDSQNIICAAMHNAFARHELVCPPREKLLSIVGLSLPEAFAKLGEGSAAFPVDTLVQYYKDAFFAFREENAHPETLYPGARETIETLAARASTLLGVATGKSQRGAQAVLTRHDLSAHFSVIKTADDAPSKPHPGMVLEAMKDIGARAEDTVMIGDSIYDMAMARAAGAHAIGVTWGYHTPDALRDAGAHVVVEDFSALVPIVDAFTQPHPEEAANGSAQGAARGQALPPSRRMGPFSSFETRHRSRVNPRPVDAPQDEDRSN